MSRLERILTDHGIEFYVECHRLIAVEQYMIDGEYFHTKIDITDWSSSEIFEWLGKSIG